MRKGLIVAATAAALTALAAFRVADLSWARAKAIDTASGRADNLAFVLSEYVREAFAAGDASLRQLALVSRRIGGPGAPDVEWSPILASARAGLTGVGSMSIVDTSGVIRHTTQPAIAGQSRRESYAFQQVASASGDELVIDRPFMSAVEPKQFLIPMARRLTTKDGAFDGAVVVSILPAAFQGFFRTINVGQRGAVWVFHPDGYVLFREPSDRSRLGDTSAANPIFIAARRGTGAGTIHAQVEPGGATMLSAFRTLDLPRLIVAVSLDRDEVLADLRHQARMSTLAFVALLMIIVTTLAVLFRQMDARARVEGELQTSQQRESERLRQANERLAEALALEQDARRESESAGRLKDEFLMTVSHELRTPLTAIYGWTRMLVTSTLSDHQKETALRAIERNARVQTKLIDDLLDVSRLIGGRLRLDLRTVDVSQLVAESIETLQPAADAKRIRIYTAIDPAVPAIGADPVRLQQVMWNLLSNAIKFTPAGGRVDVLVEPADDAIDIVVTDTGGGISPEFLPHVFERFRQADAGTMRRTGGLGLGLAIVRHLTELHGGTVCAESAGEGRGATFRLRLPVVPQSSIVESNSRSRESRYEPSTGL